MTPALEIVFFMILEVWFTNFEKFFISGLFCRKNTKNKEVLKKAYARPHDWAPVTATITAD
jgi:hypothetical protein